MLSSGTISLLALPLWRFATACAGSLLFAVLLAAVVLALARRQPALAAHRGTWLLAQAAVALVLLLACLPLPRIVTLPAIDMATVVPDAEQGAEHDMSAHLPPAPAPVERAAGPADVPAASDDTTHPALHGPLLAWLPAAWLALYLAGLLWHAVRSADASRRWHAHLLRHSHPVDLDALRDWPAITPDQLRRIAIARLTVRTTDLPLSPVLLGGRHRCLVLPDHLRMLDLAQQSMIIEHELTHWRRADPRWLALAGAGALLFWFNRPYRRLVEGLRDAVELGCDDAVLAGRGARERQGYAAALVAQLKLERLAQQACAAPAFGQSGIAQRVQRMRETRPPRLRLRARLACIAAALGTTALGTLLQPAFSAALPAVAVAAVPTPVAAAAWRYPLAQVRITSLYGVRSALLPSGHHGVDFAARKGTPVLAVAAGTVTEAASNPTWGNYVRIDHGGGRSSLVMHLERAAVVPGQRVAPGDVVGASGASGRATGPHLHLEYWRDGRRQDPQLMLADLADHATPRARARRQAQGNPIPTDQ